VKEANRYEEWYLLGEWCSRVVTRALQSESLEGKIIKQ
jgi:hypothetical protein